MLLQRSHNCQLVALKQKEKGIYYVNISIVGGLNGMIPAKLLWEVEFINGRFQLCLRVKSADDINEQGSGKEDDDHEDNLS